MKMYLQKTGFDTVENHHYQVWSRTSITEFRSTSEVFLFILLFISSPELTPSDADLVRIRGLPPLDRLHEVEADSDHFRVVKGH